MRTKDEGICGRKRLTFDIDGYSDEVGRSDLVLGLAGISGRVFAADWRKLEDLLEAVNVAGGGRSSVRRDASDPAPDDGRRRIGVGLAAQRNRVHVLLQVQRRRADQRYLGSICHPSKWTHF